MVGWSQQSGRKRSRKSHKSSGTSRSSFRSGSSSKRGLLDYLDITIDISLYTTILLVLLCFAGRTASGQFILLLGTSLTACLWFLRRGFGSNYAWKWTGLEPVFLLAVGLFLFQLTPISDSLINTVSPNLQSYLGQDLPAGSIPSAHFSSRWNFVSLAPRETRLSLVAIVCVIVLFLIMVQQFQDREKARRIVLSAGVLSAFYSVFGIVQYVFSNNKFFWVYEHPYTGTSAYSKGSFTNANHFAGFLALSLGPILAWTLCRRVKKLAQKDAWQSESQSDWHLLAGGVAIVALLIGIVLTSSRGGMLLCGVGICVTLFFIIIKKMADSRLPVLLSLGAIISLAGISVVGDQVFQKNAEELVSGDLSKLDHKNARSFIWASNINAWKQFPWLGTGLGTHEDVIPAFHISDAGRMNYTHAENSYLQIGTETGLAGWLLLAASFVMIFRALFLKIRSAKPERSDTPYYAGIAGSFSVFLVHGCYDFAWYAPAYILILGLYLAFLFSSQDDPIKTEPSARQWNYPPLIFAALAVTAGILASRRVMPAATAEQGEFQYARYSQSRNNFESPEEEIQLLRLRIVSLQQSLQADPEYSDNHLRMAKCLRRLFELQMQQANQAMPMSQIRAAVYSGGFENRRQLQTWLSNPSVMKQSLPVVKACLRHAKQSLKCCPFKSSSLLIQSDLCFIENPDALLPDYYLARAELTQPWSPEIPYTAGIHAWGQGEIDEALEAWKKVYPKDKKVARRIIEVVSTAFPPDVLIEIFEPDLDQLTEMIKAYKPYNSEHGQTIILCLARATLDHAPEMTPQEQEEVLVRAFTYLNASKLLEQTSIYIQLACEIQQDSLKMHNVFGRWLVKNKKYRLARPHLKYCLKRSSLDTQIEQLLKKCDHYIQLQSRQVVRPASFDSY